MTDKKRLPRENDVLEKFEMFCQAADKFDSSNIWTQFRAIRLLHGISKENEDLLNWICESNYKLMEDLTEKLAQKTLKGNDITIINEAQMLIKILEPYINNNKNAVYIELKCDKCGNEVIPGWNHCTSCGTKIQWDSIHICPNCKKAINPEWKLCPECGHKLEGNYCSSCKKRLELSWKICPYCGDKTG